MKTNANDKTGGGGGFWKLVFTYVCCPFVLLCTLQLPHEHDYTITDIN